MKEGAEALRRFWPAVAAGIIALILAIALGTDGDDSGARNAAPNVSGISPTATITGNPAPDGLPTVSIDDLPPEARETIDLIDQGGPFPYDQDGAVFQNREGRLPDLPSGSYQEYTVETPVESDRGARRIVKARDGTLYYSDDHYETFRLVER